MRKEIVMKLAQAFSKRQADSLPLGEPVSSPPLRIREGRITIGRALAQRILAECHYEGQRHLNTNHVRALANAMHRGRFTQGTQLHLAFIDGRYILVNGQHRVHAVIQSDAETEFSLLVTECSSMEEVAQLYYRHDTVARARGVADVVRSTKVNDDHEMTERDAIHTLAAIVIIAIGFKSPFGNPALAELRSPDARLEIAKPWWKHARCYLGAVHPADTALKRCLSRQSVMSVGMMTFKYQEDKALEFWDGVARDDGLRKGDPRKTLVRYLLEATQGGDNSVTYGMRAVAAAWNAFFEGRQLSFIRVSIESPVVIAGTPVGKKKV